MKYILAAGCACLLLAAGGAHAQVPMASTQASNYKPSVDDWVGVNAAVNNYTLGIELNDSVRLDKAFWPEGTIIAQPEPGMSFTMPYNKPPEGPPKPPAGGPAMPPLGGPGGGNAIGTNAVPWHLALSHHFEFQSPSRATHYGYFVSVYPDLETKKSVVGLPGHYEDILEKRNGEWRILQRKTVIGAK